MAVSLVASERSQGSKVVVIVVTIVIGNGWAREPPVATRLTESRETPPR
jgi:hypothetical protein